MPWMIQTWMSLELVTLVHQLEHLLKPVRRGGAATAAAEVNVASRPIPPNTVTWVEIRHTPYNKYNTSNTDAILTNEIASKELDGNSPALHLLIAALLVKARVFEIANSAGVCKLATSSYT